MSQAKKSRNADFLDRLTAIMNERDLSRSDLARELQIAWSSVDRWFQGSLPHRATLERLANHLGVTPKWLKTGEGAPNPTRALSDAVNQAIHATTLDGEYSSARAAMRGARKAKGLSFDQLSKLTKTKYRPSALQSVEEGFTRPSEKMIEEICGALGLDKADLMAGSDEPVQRGIATGTFGAIPPVRVEPGMRAKYVPLLSMAQAGMTDTAYTDSGYTYQGAIAFDPADPRAYAVTIVGDSMEDEYKEGDLAIVYPNHKPKQGNLVICRLKNEAGGDVMFKIFSSIDSGKKVRLTSYNRAYPDLDFARDDFVFIHPVAQVTKRLLKPTH